MKNNQIFSDSIPNSIISKDAEILIGEICSLVLAVGMLASLAYALLLHF